MKHFLKLWLLLAITVSGHARATKASENDNLLHSVNSKTVVFITGAFVSNSGWDEWKAYFESKGYPTLAPAWPYKAGSVEELRSRHPDKDLAALQEEQRAYDKLVIPESRVLMRDALKKPGKVDFKKPMAPLLFVGGTEDHIMPASLDKKIYKRYKKHAPKNAILDYKEFPNTNHLAMSQPGWKAEADFIIHWANKHIKPAALSEK